MTDTNNPLGVPAHRHPNGGGWVADTAHVADTAYVGPDALVFGYAFVCDEACVDGNARVFGEACVDGNAQALGNARVGGNAVLRSGTLCGCVIYMQRSDGYFFTLQPDGKIVAGCRFFTPGEADAHWGNPEHHLHAESMAILTAMRSVAAAREMQ